jgi:hypothetical protein
MPPKAQWSLPQAIRRPDNRLNLNTQGYIVPGLILSTPNASRAKLQHNMWVTNAKEAALSIITGSYK